MTRMPRFIIAALVATLTLAGCGHGDSPQDPLQQALDAGKEQTRRQADVDPARRPHPDDPNPLRRQLGDVQIKQLFFGPDQTQGDWMAWLPCSQAYFGMPIAPPNRIYLKRCPALEQYLLGRARGAGFADAAAKDVLDPQLSGAARTP